MFRRRNHTTTIPLVHVHKCHMKKSFHILFCCFFCNLNIVKGRSVLENEPKKLPKRKLLMFFFSRSFRIYSKCIQYNICYYGNLSRPIYGDVILETINWFRRALLLLLVCVFFLSSLLNLDFSCSSSTHWTCYVYIAIDT